MFNEWAIQIMCFMMMCFTDMVKLDTEPLINYKLGEAFKIFVMIVIVINLLTILIGIAPTIKAFLRRQKFRKNLPSLIKERMREREAITEKNNANLRGKLESIFEDEVIVDGVSEAALSQSEQQSDSFKKAFFMQMQAKMREKELKKMTNLTDGVDNIQKKVEKQRKRQKMAENAEELYSSSSDEDVPKTPKMKHFSHKKFDKSATRNSNLAAITEEDI